MNIDDKIDSAIIDGLANHTGEWFNPFIVKGEFSIEQLEQILTAVLGSKRLKENLRKLINNKQRN